MPQDKRRSISYRSFVTCDNPKGVIECGTIRKSKINSLKREQQHQHNLKVVVEGDKKLGNPTTSNSSSLGGIIIKEDKKMCVKEVTRDGFDVSKRGDNKLNHVTNSTWPKGKVSQEVITKDLLKGAFDLQESIIMLGKLQEEAFSSFSMSRLRRKEKCKVEEGTLDCMVNEKGRMGMGFDRPRKSTDEMKKVVRESLLRQNVIINPIFEENYDSRMMGCFSDMPSTSSSQSSSMVRSSNFVPSDSSSSSVASQRRTKKNSNLIFRLMGLESPPSSPRWHIEGEKIVTLPRKSQFGAQVLGKKQKSVKEILETLHFKGLLRSGSLNGKTSDVFSPKTKWYDERPPIVTMKPMCYKTRDLEETIMPKYSMEGILKPTCSRLSLSVEGNVTNLSANRSEEGRKSVKKDGVFRAKGSVNRDPKPQIKHEAALRKSSEVEKVGLRRKGEENKDSMFQDQEKSQNAPKIVKPKDGRIISKQQNVSSTFVFDHRKHAICDISGQQKNNRESALVEEKKKGKGKEKEIVVVSTCDTKNVLSVAKSRIFDNFIEQNLSRNQIRDYHVDASVEHCQNDTMPVCDITVADTHGYDDTNSCYSEITSVSTSENYSPVCEVTLVTTHENGIPVQDLGKRSPPFPDENEPETSPRTRLQAVLLSNSSFRNNLEEFFDIQVFSDLVPHDVGRDRVLIDYANEVMKLKSSEFSQPYLALLSIHTKETRISPLDQILEDIRNGIEGLKRYHRSTSDDTFSSDDLYLILDQDLSFKSTGTWDIGWRNTFSRHEIEVVVREVGKVVLGKLIEEVVLDFTIL